MDDNQSILRMGDVRFGIICVDPRPGDGWWEVWMRPLNLDAPLSYRISGLGVDDYAIACRQGVTWMTKISDREIRKRYP